MNTSQQLYNTNHNLLNDIYKENKTQMARHHVTVMAQMLTGLMSIPVNESTLNIMNVNSGSLFSNLTIYVNPSGNNYYNSMPYHAKD